MDLVKTLCLLLITAMSWYSFTRYRLYENKSLKKSIFTGFLFSMAIFIMGGALVSFNHWFATGILFFISLVVFVVFYEICTKGDNYFAEVERQAEEEKQKKEQAKADGLHKVQAKAASGVKHSPVFKNNRHQNKSAKANLYTANELRQIAFTYMDYNGKITQRDVAVNRFDGFKINAYCLDRRANRTFNLSNIVGEIILRETGELVTPDEWAEIVNIGQHFN